MKRYIGCDPGKSGAFASISVDGDNIGIEVYPYEDSVFLAEMKEWAFDDCICCIEEVHSMPKQGVASSFSFGKTYGYLLGVLEAYFIPYQPIKPQRWKKEFGLNSDKAKSIEVCRRLFPEVSLKRTEKCKVDHDGMAEALLMAEFARRNL